MKAELWTWASCPFCVAAIDLLEARGVEYTNHVMDGRNAELSEIKRQYGHRTVPIILLDGEFIGGFDQLRAIDARGKLVAG
jgi:glutaredoxin 3